MKVVRQYLLYMQATLNIAFEYDDLMQTFHTTDTTEILKKITETCDYLSKNKNASQNAHLTKEEILKLSVDILFDIKDFEGNYIFNQKNHWQAVYRNAVDFGTNLDGDYKGFEILIRRLGMDKYRVPFDYESLKKADEGVYMLPAEKWSLALFQKRNMKKTSTTYEERYVITMELRRILLQFGLN